MTDESIYYLFIPDIVLIGIASLSESLVTGSIRRNGRHKIWGWPAKTKAAKSKIETREEDALVVGCRAVSENSWRICSTPKDVFGSKCSFSGIFKREKGYFYLYLKISLFNTLLRTGVVIILRVFETLQFCWKTFFCACLQGGLKR